MDNGNLMEFKSVIRNNYQDYLKKNLSKEKDIEAYVEALYQGYLDACRTFKWLPESDVKKCKNDNDKRDKVKAILRGEEPAGVAYRIKNYLEEGIPDRFISFDEMHEELCVNLIQKFRAENADVSYGQVQKIINMAFKYLYCCNYDNKMKERFEVCHMPLDSFSLEWFKRCFKGYDFTDYIDTEYGFKLSDKLFKKEKKKKVLKLDSIGSWSSMKSWNDSDNNKDDDYQGETYPYEFYRNVIEEYCEKYNKKHEKKITPLQLDFIVWPKMQKIMAAEAFIKTFKDDIKPEEAEAYDVDNLKRTLENRLIKIRPLICDGTDL